MDDSFCMDVESDDEDGDSGVNFRLKHLAQWIEAIVNEDWQTVSRPALKESSNKILCDSTTMSDMMMSVWRPGAMAVLKQAVYVRKLMIEEHEGDVCQFCQVSNHPASVSIDILGGKEFENASRNSSSLMRFIMSWPDFGTPSMFKAHHNNLSHMCPFDMGCFRGGSTCAPKLRAAVALRSFGMRFAIDVVATYATTSTESTLNRMRFLRQWTAEFEKLKTCVVNRDRIHKFAPDLWTTSAPGAIWSFVDAMRDCEDGSARCPNVDVTLPFWRGGVSARSRALDNLGPTRQQQQARARAPSNCDESDGGVSDFIVDDDESLSECSSDDDDDQEPPPRKRRGTVIDSDGSDSNDDDQEPPPRQRRGTVIDSDGSDDSDDETAPWFCTGDRVRLKCGTIGRVVFKCDGKFLVEYQDSPFEDHKTKLANDCDLVLLECCGLTFSEKFNAAMREATNARNMKKAAPSAPSVPSSPPARRTRAQKRTNETQPAPATAPPRRSARLRAP
jgi:hypothetical protein